MKTLAFFHIGRVSGPSKTLYPSLERLAGRGELEVVVPRSAAAGPGSVARQYAPIAAVTAIDYEPLTMPSGPTALARAGAAAIRDLRALRAHVRCSGPDLVVVATSAIPAAVLAARSTGVPTIVRVAEIFDKRHVGGRLRGLGSAALVRLLGSSADLLVCSSHAVAAQFAPGARAVVATIYPGIGPEHARGDGAGLRARLGLERADPLIAVVGNITAARGQDVALRALARLREQRPLAQLLLAGEPHDRAADLDYAAGLRDLAAELGLDSAVTWAGFVEPVGDVYAAADVVVNPARFNEPFGRAALEALAADRPVVASRVGAIPEVLRADVDALLVAPDDPSALAAALERITADPALAARIAATGRARVEAEFGVERVASEFERLALALLPERRGGRASVH